jgi:hypothetical protein
MAAPIPPSQRNVVRTLARKAWRLAQGDVETAGQIVEKQIGREIGGAWVLEGNRLAVELLEHWKRHGIEDPASVFVAGEPGTPTDE